MASLSSSTKHLSKLKNQLRSELALWKFNWFTFSDKKFTFFPFIYVIIFSFVASNSHGRLGCICPCILFSYDNHEGSIKKINQPLLTSTHLPTHQIHRGLLLLICRGLLFIASSSHTVTDHSNRSPHTSLDSMVAKKLSQLQMFFLKPPYSAHHSLHRSPHIKNQLNHKGSPPLHCRLHRRLHLKRSCVQPTTCVLS